MGRGFATVTPQLNSASHINVSYEDGTEATVERDSCLLKPRSQSHHQLTLLMTPFESDARGGRVYSAVFNLISTILGGGILSLPSAIQEQPPHSRRLHSRPVRQACGAVLGGIALLLSAAASAFTVDLLVSTATRISLFSCYSGDTPIVPPMCRCSPVPGPGERTTRRSGARCGHDMRSTMRVHDYVHRGSVLYALLAVSPLSVVWCEAFGSRAQLFTVGLIAVLTWMVCIAYAVLIGNLRTRVRVRVGVRAGMPS